MKRSIPIWVSIVAGILTLGGFAFTITLYIMPQNFFPKTDFSILDVKHFTDMWALRQFAISVLIAYALIRQDGIMLKTSLILVTLINLLTIPLAILRQDNNLIMESVVYTGIGVLMIFALIKREKYLKN